MKKINSYFLFAVLISFVISFSSCEAIAGIFKAGVWVGVLLVLIVIGLIVFLVSKKK